MRESSNNLSLVSINGFIVENNKSVPTTIIRLGPSMTVLYGRNGAGKSAILDQLTEENLLLSYKVNPDLFNPNDEDEVNDYLQQKAKELLELASSGISDLIRYHSGELRGYPWPDGHQDHVDREYRAQDVAGALESWLEDGLNWIEENQIPFPENLLVLQIMYLTGLTPIDDFDEPKSLKTLELIRQACWEISKHGELRRRNILIADSDPTLMGSYAHAEMSLVIQESERTPLLSQVGEIFKSDDELAQRFNHFYYCKLDDYVTRGRETGIWIFPSWRTEKQKRDTKVMKEIPISTVEAIRPRYDKRFNALQLYEVNNGQMSIHPDLQETAQTWSRTVNEILSLLLDDAPLLTFWIKPPVHLPLQNEPAFGWRAFLPNKTLVPLSTLSTAEQRWASIAIQLTEYKLYYRNSEAIVVIDEPESHLHRQAERHLVRGLEQLARDLDIKICVASHSPAFLASKEATLIHVYREIDNGTSLTAMDSPSVNTLDIFAEKHGLNRSDLLQLVKWFVLVEGEHDRLLINEWLPELTNFGAHVLAMRGIKPSRQNMGSLLTSETLTRPEDWQMIYRFSEAKVLMIVDGINGDTVSRLWAEIRDLPFKKADPMIRDFLSGKGARSEREWIAMQMREAISGGFAGRLQPYALNKPDIIQYLDPRLLSQRLGGPTQTKSDQKPIDTLWKPIVEHWKSRTARGDFKTFLRNEYGMKINPSTLARAARSTRTVDIPTDISRIADLLR